MTAVTTHKPHSPALPSPEERPAADVVVFDPATIQDHATFVKPHQYAIGVSHVIVNGTLALADGEPTDARPTGSRIAGVSRVPAESTRDVVESTTTAAGSRTTAVVPSPSSLALS